MSKASIHYQLYDITGKRDVKELKRELDSFRGVISVSANPAKNTLSVDFDDTGVQCEQLTRHLEKLGYAIENQKLEVHRM